MGCKMSNKSEMIIYQTEDGLTKVNVTFDADTVWLSLEQMSELFQRDKSTISRHIRNIFSEGELNRTSTVANFATVQNEGNRQVERKIEYYASSAVSVPIGISEYDLGNLLSEDYRGSLPTIEEIEAELGTE